jgi:hypothetical protein
MEGELRVFLEAFLWIGLDLGISTITLFEQSERFVDEVIASFNYECVHDRIADIADLSDGDLTLRYAGAPTTAQHYTVEGVLIDADFTLANLSKKGYLVIDNYTRAEQAALRDQIADFRTNHAGEYAVVVSTDETAEFFLGSQVNGLTVQGTDSADQYKLKGLNGVVENITLRGGGGADVIELFANADLPDATLDTLTIDGDGGEDVINVDAALLGSLCGSRWRG